MKDAQGLSLSTASDTDNSESANGSSTGIVEIILAVCAGVTISGLILLFTGAYIVYIFRKNWKRWGAGKLYLTPEEENVYMADGFGEPDTDDDVWDSEGVVHEEIWIDPDEESSAESDVRLDAKLNGYLNKEESFYKESEEKKLENNTAWEGEKQDEI